MMRDAHGELDMLPICCQCQRSSRVCHNKANNGRQPFKLEHSCWSNRAARAYDAVTEVRLAHSMLQTKFWFL